MVSEREVQRHCWPVDTVVIVVGVCVGDPLKSVLRERSKNFTMLRGNNFCGKQILVQKRMSLSEFTNP